MNNTTSHPWWARRLASLVLLLCVFATPAAVSAQDEGTDSTSSGTTTDPGTWPQEIPEKEEEGEPGPAGTGNQDVEVEGPIDEPGDIPEPFPDAGNDEAVEEPASEDELGTDAEIDWGEEETVRDPSKGVVKGRVTSSATGDAMIEARVNVQNSTASTLTDIDGNYELELAPGTYSLRVWGEMHQPQIVSGIVVEAGGEQTIDVALVGDEDAIIEVVVEAEAQRNKAEVQIERRKRAAVVSDTVSGEEIARTPDSSAADATRRVVGLSVQDGSYVVIRGLSGRYVTSLLDRTPVPSPEPDVPALPLDLFPASMLSSMLVAKTATPDLPGNFAGGALILDTAQYPSDFQLSFKFGLSGDTVTTFADAPFYEGAKGDWLTLGADKRRLPRAVPKDAPVVNRGARRLDDATVERITESFENEYTLSDQTMPLNYSFGASVGDTVRPFGKRLGYLFSMNYGQSYDIRRYTLKDAMNAADGSGVVERKEGREELVEATQEVGVGALGSVAFEVAPGHSLGLVSLFTRGATDRASERDNLSTLDLDTQLQYTLRQISFNQLTGHHRIDGLGGLEFDWQANVGFANRDEPDTREIAYEDDGVMRSFNLNGGSAQRSFITMDETTYGGGADLSRQFDGFKPKVGVLFTHSDRDYTYRKFRYDDARGAIIDPALLRNPLENILTDDNIGPLFVISEQTNNEDNYTADAEVLSGYAMLDVSAFEPFRAVVGVRYETAWTRLVTGTETTTRPAFENKVDRIDESWLPSVNLTYALARDLNLRGAYSMTVARPQFRELAPILYRDFRENRNVSGNPDLEQTTIQNYDLRLEYFPGATEVLAASVFAKRMKDPIEQTVVGAEKGSLTFTNSEEAEIIGFELEARIGLSYLTAALDDFGLTANYTWVDSEVSLTEEQRRLSSNATRPLQGQSPYVINVGLLYERPDWGTTAQVLYNVFGRRLTEVGSLGLPDRYEEPVHRLDVVASQGLGAGFSLKLAATNLLDEEVVETVGDIEVSRYRPGVGASASLGWSY